MTSDNTFNYVAAWQDYDADKIIVLERDADGTKRRLAYNPPYYFYVKDEEGEELSIYGDKISKREFASRDEYERDLREWPTADRFESDFNPLKRVLMDNYYERPSPPVQYAFLDIEVDYSRQIGFAGPMNPYADINAVTVYQSWTKQYLTYVIPPKGWAGQLADLYTEFDRLVADKQLPSSARPEITIVPDERALLSCMLKALDEADIISGWNSEFFDLPYICERLQLEGGDRLVAKLDHLGVPRGPKKVMKPHFGSEEPVYELTGKAHLDYMALFKKFTFEGRSSFSLGNILQEEVGLGKLEYDGSLEELYNNDFAKFTVYNFRDVSGLVQLDEKFKFVALANQMAHESTVLFGAVLGTVAYVETAIANHAHYALNKKVLDKHVQDHDKVEGAIVMTPKIGLYEWVGAVDINSLYPNTIRSLNISPEKIVGQFGLEPDEGEAAWRDIREGNQNRHTLTIGSGAEARSAVAEAAQWKEVLKANSWAVSAYGTVFDQSNGRGVVADILGFWYSERKRLQAEKKKWAKKVKELTPGTPEYLEAKKQEEHYDLLQLTKKISMNSLYGSLLNKAFRFGDERMGASVTATGRAITAHMIEKLGYILTGRPHHLDRRVISEIMQAGNGDNYVKTKDFTLEEWNKLPRSGFGMAVYKALMWVGGGEPDWTDFSQIKFSSVIIYGDTDSSYFTCAREADEQGQVTVALNKAEAVEIADLAADETNASFPEFMREAFLCQPEFDGLIKAGRELVAERGLFQAKKKYVLKVVDLEGFAVDKLKTMGSEIKKSDTPKIIQRFLEQVVQMILDGQTYDEIATFINEQRKVITKQKANVFLMGVAKQVNNLDKFLAEYLNPGSQASLDKNGKLRNLTIPGHARAACNYNHLLELHDKGGKAIRSGDKVLVFYLKPNEHKFESIAFPAELSHFPKWFDENFTVDIKKTEEKMFDSKLEGIFAALGKDVPSPASVLFNKLVEF